jgi:hypothetical protein
MTNNGVVIDILQIAAVLLPVAVALSKPIARKALQNKMKNVAILYI